MLPRDVIVRQVWDEVVPGTTVVLATSCSDASVPAGYASGIAYASGIVRAAVAGTAVVIREISDGQSMLSYMPLCDLKGYRALIPLALSELANRASAFRSLIELNGLS